MFNDRQIDIIERNTYVDEFEKFQPVENNAQVENDYSTSEHIAFNSKISDNFDRIMHYDTYNKQAEIQERNNVYTKFSQGVNVDAMPSNTTMQFKGMQKSDIYEDYRSQETPYDSTSQIRLKSKLLICFMAVILTVLSVLVVFNTTLLNNMNVLINEKSSQIEMLETQNSEYLNIHQSILNSNVSK